MHTIYEGTIAWTINEDTGHNNRVEKPRSLYVPKGSERLTSPQNWSQNSTSAYADATTLDDTRCTSHHDRDTLIWGVGRFISNVPLDKNVFSLYRLLLDTLRSLHIVLLLAMTHIYMRIILNVSLTNFMFSVALRPIKAQLHLPRIHIRLQREKPQLQREVGSKD